MPRLPLLATLLLMLPATTWAQGTGVSACDVFLQAYAQCATDANLSPVGHIASSAPINTFSKL